MRILFLSSVCSLKVFQNIFEHSRLKPLQSIQKVYQLLLKGFPENVHITALSTPPVRNMKKRFVRFKKVVNQNISFVYIPMTNILFVRTLLIVFYSFFFSLWWMSSRKKDKPILVCDIFSFWSSLPALFVAKLLKVKTTVIVTDLPQLVHAMTNRNVSCFSLLFWTELFATKLLNSFDSYILFSEAMNEVVNKRGKPYMIMEGLVDNTKMNMQNLDAIKDEMAPFEFMYCGGIYEKYGLKNLIEAFLLIENKNIKLSLYGEGDMVESLIHYMRKDKRIVYYGTLPNEEILIREQKATVLVNPRFSKEPLAKYSFPSKNMEYMSSGTPVLTTHLPGMPSEYNQYVFFIDDESVEGMKISMERLISMDRKALKEMGSIAYDFVVKKKNNIVQAERVIQFILAI